VLAAAAFIPRVGAPVDSRTALAGGLLAGGTCAILAIFPLGGWAAGAMTAVRGADLAPWALLLAPAVLFTVGLLLPLQPLGTRTPLANTLLGLGLVTALLSGVQALRDRASAYGRVLIADLALAAAALGTLHPQAQLGGYLIVLSHLCAAPLLLNPARPGLERQRRMAWLSLVTVPPLPGFWGRFLCLQAFAAAGTRVSTPAYVAVVVLNAVALRGLVGRDLEPRPGTPPASFGRRVLAWAVVAALFGLGLAPQPIAHQLFGVAS
jgi:formate hydrogenlyase subunit 3/multisubunit Na+/H+ antiporter MnhD subunit